MKFRVPKTEISTAADTHHKCDQKRALSRKDLLKILDNHLLPSVIFVLRKRVRNYVVSSEQKLQGKLATISKRQDKPLRPSNEKNVVVLDNIILPGLVRDLLAFGPKHPIKDKFKELHFLADIDSLTKNLRENNVPGEKQFENEAAAKCYSKNIREAPLDRALANVQKYLRYNALFAVPFDKGVGFCVMKKSTYAEKLEKVLDGEQFRKLEKSSDNIVMKNEKELNKKLLDPRKKGKIPVKVSEALSFNGAQLARLYGLAKVHMRPVLSIPGTCYHELNKFLSSFFQKIEGANIEINTNDTQKTPEQIKLEKDEEVLSLDV